MQTDTFTLLSEKNNTVYFKEVRAASDVICVMRLCLLYLLKDTEKTFIHVYLCFVKGIQDYGGEDKVCVLLSGMLIL